MKLTSIKRLLAVGVLLPALLFSSCMREQLDNPLDGDQAQVTFSLNVPGASKPSTRAMTEEQENAISAIHIIAFKDGVFSYRTSGTQIEPNGALNKKKFSATLRKGIYDIVIVANATDMLGGNMSGKSKADAMKMLEAAMPSGGKWAVTGSVKSIPMWGNVGLKNVGTDVIPEISLLRMVARVNVTLDEASSRFSLQNVHLYNYNTKGMLAPAQADWDVSPVSAPHLPAAPGFSQGVAGRIGFTATTAGVSSINDVYMFEAAAGSKTTISTNPCIVVGGTYDGQPAYYRIDFATDPDTYLAIKRNHSYNIRITAVKNSGHPTADEAFNAGPENITVNILQWNDGGMGNVVFDGQNMLGVSQGEFDIPLDADSYTTQIKTDATGGWTATESADWITLVTDSGAGDGQNHPLTFNVTENTGTAPRTGIITVKAGRLEYLITVVQADKPTFGIEILNALSAPITELVFSSPAGVQPAAQTFTVNWRPAASDLTITNAAIGGNSLPYGSGAPDNGIVTDGTGTKTYTIQPSPMSAGELSINPFRTKVSKVDFSITDGFKYAGKSIFLRQLVYNTIAKVEDNYMLDNTTTHSFSIRSNTEWKITSVSDPDGILDYTYTPALLNRTGGNNTTDNGQTVNFKLVTDATGAKNGKAVTLTLTDPTGRMTPVTVILTGVTCGTGGVALTQEIGGTQYMTHQYGDKCWMVENLRHGFPSAYSWNNTGYPFGYYYEDYQNPTQCPAGWHIPTQAEADALVAAITPINASTGSKWWGGFDGELAGAFAGKYQEVEYSHPVAAWEDWGSKGYWWYSHGIITSNATEILVLQYYPAIWCSIRCVRD